MLKLSQWTAQKDFWSICRDAMANNVTSSECITALSRPPTPPPIPRGITDRLPSLKSASLSDKEASVFGQEDKEISRHPDKTVSFLHVISWALFFLAADIYIILIPFGSGTLWYSCQATIRLYLFISGCGWIIIGMGLYIRRLFPGHKGYEPAFMRGYMFSIAPFILLAFYMTARDYGFDSAWLGNHILLSVNYCGEIVHQYSANGRFTNNRTNKESTLTGAITTGFHRPGTAPLPVIIERSRRNGKAKAFLA
ncbi:hypothetical protein GQ44DRAFT_780040 [Phaeosphaeriaceae sp. PMI808]|nr:hypothetical protein GQ44DRAFT_780040 [Phaeosphaeriaceae sp. PMI808]